MFDFVKVSELGNKIPRLDQLPAFQDKLSQMPQNIKQKLIGNEFDRAEFLINYALMFNSKV